MSSIPALQGLIEADALDELLRSGAKVKLVDASYNPGIAEENFLRRRIDGAVFFDIDLIADPRSPMAHMLPSPEDFAQAVSALGIGNDDLVVVYDQSGIAMAASRAWWMFRVFGHDNVCVLNGGLPYWMATGHEVSDSPCEKPAPAVFKANYRPELVKGLTEMQQALQSRDATILDARSAERFSGRVPEPRPGLRSGHIPGSLNLPFMSLLDNNGRLPGPDSLREKFRALPAAGQTIATCGSGVTACVLALAFYTIGKQDVSVYDGSWTEWGQEDQGTAVAALS